MVLILKKNKEKNVIFTKTKGLGDTKLLFWRSGNAFFTKFKGLFKKVYKKIKRIFIFLKKKRKWCAFWKKQKKLTKYFVDKTKKSFVTFLLVVFTQKIKKYRCLLQLQKKKIKRVSLGLPFMFLVFLKLFFYRRKKKNKKIWKKKPFSYRFLKKLFRVFPLGFFRKLTHNNLKSEWLYLISFFCMKIKKLHESDLLFSLSLKMYSYFAVIASGLRYNFVEFYKSWSKNVHYAFICKQLFLKVLTVMKIFYFSTVYFATFKKYFNKFFFQSFLLQKTNYYLDLKLKTIFFFKPQSLCYYIYYRLKQKGNIRNIVFPVFNILKKNATFLSGLVVSLKGRFIRKRPRASYSLFRWGSLRYSSINANIDYAEKTITLRYGMCMIRVWCSYKN